MRPGQSVYRDEADASVLSGSPVTGKLLRPFPFVIRNEQFFRAIGVANQRPLFIDEPGERLFKNHVKMTPTKYRQAFYKLHMNYH
ncbi:hypothetical protein [Cohnella lubricantis]|uniref:Uncharacterized protein n=1 Tax=Cohnella lubricantis TaxID=2163172 RepID=A0A841TJR7_9BACL|nr:hypothetical protein [Cohnella lubricantis]MBB6679177.1 hypothetical protein [Cohnella lubricantis]MBP2120167.1 hypothetical protein [Cohnella lubricantis]